MFVLDSVFLRRQLLEKSVANTAIVSSLVSTLCGAITAHSHMIKTKAQRITSAFVSVLVVVLMIGSTPAFAGVEKELTGTATQYDFLDSSTVTGTVSIPVFFCTNRARLEKGAFGDSAGEVTYGRISVTVPLRKNLTDKAAEGLGWSPQKKILTIPQLQAMNDASHSTIFSSQSDFIQRVQQSMSQSGANHVVVFVHGFNNSLDDAIISGAELAYWYRQPIVVFGWPGAKATEVLKIGSVYQSSELTVDSNLGPYANLVKAMSNQKGIGPAKLILIAHSMGNHLLYQFADEQCKSDPPAKSKFHELVFCSADIDGAQFANEAPCISKIASQTRVYFSRNDFALKQSKPGHAGNPRLGSAGSHISRIANLPDVQAIDVEQMLLGYFDHDIADWLVADMSEIKSPSWGDWRIEKEQSGIYKLIALKGNAYQRWFDRLKGRVLSGEDD